jgi:hypothetical protein
MALQTRFEIVRRESEFHGKPRPGISRDVSTQGKTQSMSGFIQGGGSGATGDTNPRVPPGVPNPGERTKNAGVRPAVTGAPPGKDVA